MQKNRWGAVGMLLLFLITIVFPLQAFAMENVEVSQESNVKISYHDGKTPLQGAEFFLYQVAVKDANGNLIPAEGFEGYFGGGALSDAEQWQSLVPELHQYIREYNLSAMANEKTDADGMAIFSDNGSPLPSGLYLVVGSRHRQNGYYYDTLPFLVMPTGNVLQAAPKSEKHPEPGDPGDPGTSIPPDEEIPDTQTPTDGGPDLPGEIDEPDMEIPDMPTPLEGWLNIPGVPILPQTGQLWWPVPLLLAGGLLLVVLGLSRRREVW